MFLFYIDFILFSLKTIYIKIKQKLINMLLIIIEINYILNVFYIKYFYLINKILCFNFE